MKLHEGQQLVSDCSARFRLVRHGRRWGGTWLCIHEALKHARENNGSMVAVVVPFARMAKVIHWPLLKDEVSYGEVMTVNSRMVIHFKNGSTIIVVSAENENSLCGIGLDFAVFDVAGMMKRDMWMLQVRPAISDRNGKALFCFTPPFDKRGVERAKWLWGIEQADRNGWQSFHFASANSPYVRDDEIGAAKIACGTAVFNTEFLGQWPDESYLTMEPRS